MDDGRLRRRRARRRRATPRPSRRALGLTVGGAVVRERDLVQEAFEAGQCDGWSSDASQLTGCARRTRTGPTAPDDPARGVLQGAAGSGRRRRRLAVGAGRRMGDLRHDPGRGVRHHVGQRRRAATPATTRPPTVPRREVERRGRDAVLDPGPRSARRLRLPGRHPGRQLRRDLRGQPDARSASSAASTRCGPTAGSMYAPPYR